MTHAVVRDGHPLEALEGEEKEAGDGGIARGTLEGHLEECSFMSWISMVQPTCFRLSIAQWRDLISAFQGIVIPDGDIRCRRDGRNSSEDKVAPLILYHSRASFDCDACVPPCMDQAGTRDARNATCPMSDVL